MSNNELDSLLEDKTKNALGGCLTIIILIAISPLAALWSGWVMLELYKWFIVPIPGAPVISIGNMIGASLIVNMNLAWLVLARYDSGKKKWTETLSEALSKSIVIPAVFLLLGWIYQLWFMR